MDFKLDTSGYVQCPAPDQKPNETTGCWFWSDLSPFEQGYVRAALEAASDLYIGSSDETARFSDLAPSALARMLDDCRSFVNIATGLGIKTLGEVEGRYFWIGRQSGTLKGPFAAAYPKLRLHLTPEGKVDIEEAPSC